MTIQNAKGNQQQKDKYPCKNALTGLEKPKTTLLEKTQLTTLNAIKTSYATLNTH